MRKNNTAVFSLKLGKLDFCLSVRRRLGFFSFGLCLGQIQEKKERSVFHVGNQQPFQRKVSTFALVTN